MSPLQQADREDALNCIAVDFVIVINRMPQRCDLQPFVLFMSLISAIVHGPVFYALLFSLQLILILLSFFSRVRLSFRIDFDSLSSYLL